ncbi:MAG: hypothetical protein IJ024_04445 [Lachnospiraceae bacterium]|nr:hypothetical protein [Lachnospiraceae bacterium]
MRRKLILLMIAFMLVTSVVAGCGSGKGEEQKSMTGTFMEKKDFMFTLLDSEGTYYGFSFDEKPKNYDDLNDGDRVKVTYTGIISEVDPFKGEIISIEKLQ